MAENEEVDPLQGLLDRARARLRHDEIRSVVLLGIDSGGRVHVLDQRNKVEPQALQEPGNKKIAAVPDDDFGEPSHG